MHQITISVSDKAYAIATERARQEGFGSTETFLSEFIDYSITPEIEDYSHVFTPEVIAELEDISREIKAGGKTYSMDEVDIHFKAKREAWIANHQS